MNNLVVFLIYAPDLLKGFTVKCFIYYFKIGFS